MVSFPQRVGGGFGGAGPMVTWKRENLDFPWMITTGLG